MILSVTFLFLFSCFFLPLLGDPFVILLNGTSSAGKTSIAKKLQEQFNEPLLYLGYDHFVTILPDKFLGDSVNSQEGVQYVYKGEKKVSIKYGPIGKRISKIARQSMKNYVDAGFSIVIDEVLFDNDVLKDYLRLFKRNKVYFVSIKPSLITAEGREKERGDRKLGLARGLYEIVYDNKVYDFEIDSSNMTPTDIAQMILAWIQKHPIPHAFAYNRSLHLVETSHN